MELDLRHCRKCKRRTLQVKRRVLSVEDERYLTEFYHYITKAALPKVTSEQLCKQREKEKGLYDNEKKRCEKETWYCSCCGKEWIFIERRVKGRYEKVKFPPYANSLMAL